MGSLGWAEILMILAVALIIFGPRKLPELGKSLGQSLAQFRRASEDFKRTWEDEVEMEKRRLEEATGEPPMPGYDSWDSTYQADQVQADADSPTVPSGEAEATEESSASEEFSSSEESSASEEFSSSEESSSPEQLRSTEEVKQA